MSRAPSTVRLQPMTRARVRTLGDVGRAWSESLPEQLAALAARWSLRLGSSLPGGSNSYVCRAERSDGTEVVLKVCLPTEELDVQVAMLRSAGGRGYVRLLDADLDTRAVLLERLGPALPTGGLPVTHQLAVLADTLAAAWLPADAVPELSRPPDKAASLAAGIETFWADLDRPCPERVVAAALDDAEWLRTHPSPRPVLVHGDPHPHNALRVRTPRPGAETGHVFVDPTGFVEDRCYDLGVTIRDYSGTLLAAERPATLIDGWARQLADRTGEDADRIRRWGFLERVSSGLYVLSFGADAVARPFLASAERLLDDR